MAESPESINGHWSKLFPRLQTTPLEFYGRVEQAIKCRAIPNTVIERVAYREGGAFSGIREYLRVRRRTEVFDICGAPFGEDFFFSWWFAEVRPSFPSLVSILIVLGYLAVVWLLVKEAGIIAGPVLFVLLVPLALFLLRQLGRPETDDLIMRLPLLGGLYIRFFNPITYYRLDTSDMFQQVVREVVFGVIDEVTAAKGIRAMTELERKPVMRDFLGK